MFSCFFFFNDTATTEIYTLSLHDALPILRWRKRKRWQFWEWLLVERVLQDRFHALVAASTGPYGSISSRFHPGRGVLLGQRSEEHTSELQSQSNLVCRLLLENKKKTTLTH